ncbi:MAG TPA: NAAT family transporter [Actinomycetales bacterium]|nr:NAAT family transporter [Actinomycetales bacterium]
MSLLAAFMVFFMIMDPLGNIPLFFAALRSTPPERRQRVILRECLIALVVMVAFLFGGPSLLNLLGIEGSALEAAGGVILLLIAIRMVFPTPERNLRERGMGELGEPFIVPMAVPYFAGPSLLAMEVVLISQNFGAWPTYLGALVLAWFVSAVILYGSGFLLRVVGERTLIAMERLMGMILVILAIQMMLNGSKNFFVGA